MKILDRLPIMERSSSLGFGARFTTVHRDQILVWVSVDSAGALRASENLKDVWKTLAVALLGVFLFEWYVNNRRIFI